MSTELERRGAGSFRNTTNYTPPPKQWNGQWKAGDAIDPMFVRTVVMPLMQRGYLSPTVFGLKGLSGQQQIDRVTSTLNNELQQVKAGNYLTQDGSNPAQPQYLTTQVRDAIHSFQSDNHLDAHGAVTPQTLATLSDQAHLADVQTIQAQTLKRIQRNQLSATADPSIAANAAQMKFFYPWVPASTVASMAYEGLGISDQFTQQVAKMSLNDNANPWWQNNPQLVQRSAAGQHLGYADLAPAAQKFIDTKGQSTGPIYANAAVTSPGGVAGFLSDAAMSVGQAEESVLKPAARWADAALSAPIEEINAGIRNVVGGGGFQGAQGFNQQTRLGQAFQGESMGSGYFAEGDAARLATAAQQRAFSIDGHALTIGRGVAAAADSALSPIGVHAVEPGSTGYNILSGAIDAGVSIYGDPANFALNKLGEARKAAQVISNARTATNVSRGLIGGIRRTFIPENAASFLDSPAGRRVTEWAAKNDDFEGLLHQFRDPHVAVALQDATTPDAARSILADAFGSTVRNKVFAPTDIGHDLVHPFQALGYAADTKLEPWRILGTKPGSLIDVNDPRQAVDEIGRMLANGKADRNITFDGKQMLATEAMARASMRGAPAMLDVAKRARANLFEKLAGHPATEEDIQALVKGGMTRAAAEAQYVGGLHTQMPPEWANKMVQMFDPDRVRGYLTHDYAGNAVPPAFQVDGEVFQLPHPAAYVDLLSNGIPLPDSHGIKQLTSWVGPLLQNKKLSRVIGGAVGGVGGGIVGYDNGGTLQSTLAGAVGGAALGSGLGGARTKATNLQPYGDFFPTVIADSMTRAFKTLSVLRPATTLRVMADEQAAIALDGGISFFNHPIKALAWTLGAPLNNVRSGAGRRAGGLIDDDFAGTALNAARQGQDATEFGKAMSGGMQNLIQHLGGSRRTQGAVEIRAGDPRYVSAWAEKLRHYSEDPVWRYAASHTREDTLDWFQSGAGKRYFDYMAGSLTKAPREGIPIRPDDFDFTRQGEAERYIDFTYNEMRTLTGSDPQIGHLLVSKGQILNNDGEPIPLHNLTGKKVRDPATGETIDPRLTLNPEARTILEAKAALPGTTAPKSVYGSIAENDPSKVQRMDDAVDHLFGVLHTRPSNRLNRSPYFRQQYWNRVTELLPVMSPADAQAAITQAGRQGLGDDVLKPMRKAAAQATEGDTVGYNMVDQLAKGHALDQSKKLLYDLTKRSQLFDSLRLLAPFGDVWKQAMQRWIRLGSENPRVLRRVDQGMKVGKDSGFFYTDPTTGQEIFNYPFSQGFNKLATSTLTGTGVDVPTTGALDAVNVVGSGLPGVGWMVQMPAQLLINNLPTTRDAAQAIGIDKFYRDQIAPYGDQRGGDPISMAVNAAVPGWADRFRELLGDPTQARQMGFTQADVERYLMTTGKYGQPGQGLSEDDMKRLRGDASKASKVLVMLRAFGAAGLPAAPNFQYEMIDRTGKLAMTAALQTELSDLIRQEQAGKIPSADQQFIKTHGLDVYAALTPLTQSISSGLPTTEKQADWVRANLGVKGDYPGVYGLFAPPDPKGTYDARLVQEQVANGERKAPDNRTWLRLGNDRLAQHLYDIDRDAVNKAFAGQSIPQAVRDVLSKRYNDLVKTFPGFGESHDPSGKMSPADLLQQIRGASTDPRLRNTDQAKAVREYLASRDAVSQAYASQSKSGNDAGWITSRQYQPVRAALRAEQVRLEAKYPASSGIFHTIFAADVRGE